MTKHVDTAFERHFSEPPVLSVKEGRTHCEACKEPLDPAVMHQCHGNQEYQAPVISSTEITEACPECGAFNHTLMLRGTPISSCVVICTACRTMLGPEVASSSDAYYTWNATAKMPRPASGWPRWLAGLVGDDERANVIPNLSSAAPALHPDLTNYQGACPAVHVEGEICEWCENTGTIPPTKPEPEGAQ